MRSDVRCEIIVARWSVGCISQMRLRANFARSAQAAPNVQLRIHVSESAGAFAKNQINERPVGNAVKALREVHFLAESVSHEGDRRICQIADVAAWAAAS